jgi:acetyl esterase
MSATTDKSELDPADDPDIDRRTRAFLRELNGELNMGSSPFWELPGDQPRNIVTALQERTPVDLTGITVATQQIDSDGRPITIHVVRPAGAVGILPVFLFFHGAVWIAGNFENHKRLVRDLVVGSKAAAVCVQYTPVPEACYPVQLQQAHDAAVWIRVHGHAIGVDGSRLAVSGNDVGGNLAAALTLMAHDEGAVNVVYQQLLWPALDIDQNTGSYRAYGEGRFLPGAFMRYGWDHYVPDADLRHHRYVAPLHATIDELRGLPPTLIQTAGNDVLRDGAEAYARKLDEAGVDVTCVRYNGAIHGFGLLNALRDVPSTETALRQAAADLALRLYGNR